MNTCQIKPFYYFANYSFETEQNDKCSLGISYPVCFSGCIQTVNYTSTFMACYQVTRLRVKLFWLSQMQSLSFLFSSDIFFSASSLLTCTSPWKSAKGPVLKGENIQGWSYSKLKILEDQKNLAYLGGWIKPPENIVFLLFSSFLSTFYKGLNSRNWKDSVFF